MCLCRTEANSILGKAEDVLENLKSAGTAQEAAERAINQADSDISNAEADLTQVSYNVNVLVVAHWNVGKTAGT